MKYHNDRLFSNTRLGRAQTFGSMSWIPLFSANKVHLDYKTLPELNLGEDLRISELRGGASVGELLITNDTDEYILLIDGEELVGAKQNRALNTNVMIRPQTSTNVPVSCTERGRWRFTSKYFQDSGIVMPLEARYNKKRSVDSSLDRQSSFRSDQRQVWNDIDRMYEISNERTSTDAMRDVYESQSRSIEGYTDAFRHEPGQTGCVVLIDGEIVGIEMFSKDTAMQALGPKLVISYAMDVILGCTQSQKPMLEADIDGFISDIRSLTPLAFKSTGAGWDYRFESDHITGSALVYNGEVLQASFYNRDLVER